MIKISFYLREKEFEELKKILSRVKDNLGVEKIFLDLIPKTRKGKQQIYKDTLSFFQKELDLSQIEIDDLIDKNILKYTSKKDNKLTLTLKSILILEYGLNSVSEGTDELIDDLNKEFYENVFQLSDDPLTSLERAIIIGMIGVEAISNEYCIKPDEENQDYLKSVVDCASEFLKKLGPDYNDGSLEKLWKKVVIGEGPILAEFRRLNKIPIHTEGIYKKEGGKHYLDLVTDKSLNEPRTIYIIKKLFDKRPLNFDEKKEFLETLENIHSFEFKIFKDNPPFDSFEVRKSIKRLIENFA